MSSKVDRAIEGIIIDWLQWNDFELRMDQPDYPQLTLTLISDLKKEIKRLQEYEWKYKELCK